MRRARTLAVTVCALALALAVEPAGATFPGTNGRIAFTSTRDGKAEIYLMNPDGSAVVRLTNNSTADDNPNVAPNGQKIVFDRTAADNTRGLFTMNPNGSAQAPLISAEDDVMPVFSHDGSRIAFTSTARAGFQADIFGMNADGSGVVDLSNNGAVDVSPDFLPDGRIAFTSRRTGDNEIFVMNGDGSSPVNLTNNPGSDVEPSVSPDGSRVTFGSDRDGNYEIYTMNIDGSGQTRLTNNDADDFDPAFSPDGTRIVFTTLRNVNTGDLYVMNADGSSGPTRLTTSSAVDGEASWSSLPLGAATTAEPDSGKTVVVDEVKGTVLTKCKGQSKFTDLKKEKEISIGCEIDTRKGTVELTSAADSNGEVQTSQFFDGLFKIAQKKGKPETTLSLSGSLNCGTKKSSLHSAAKRGRRLWGRGSGRFRTKGRRGSAAVRGTYWLIEDRCDDSTLTKVKEGSVTFTDTVNKRTVIVQAGQTYVAKKGSSPNPTPPVGGGEEEVR